MTGSSRFRCYVALRGAGFTPEQARALIAGGLGVIGYWPTIEVLAVAS